MASESDYTGKLRSLADIDRIVHEPARFMILSLLLVVEKADFIFLMKQTGLTWGNLSSHLSKLEESGYIEVEKKFVGKKPRTMLRLTEQGRTAFRDYHRRMKEVLGERFVEQQTTFAGFARDCAKSSTTVVRTYQETVTDALETGFSFEGISLSAYATDTDLPEGIELDQAVAKAIALEETAIAFYQAVAVASESLLATIPRAFKRVARTRRRRKDKMQAL